jgi:hypothetical protein
MYWTWKDSPVAIGRCGTIALKFTCAIAEKTRKHKKEDNIHARICFILLKIKHGNEMAAMKMMKGSVFKYPPIGDEE